MCLARAHILIVLVLKLLSFGAGGTPAGENVCSCYTFENDLSMSWQQAERSCEFNKKHLVVMETEREWEFIKKKISNTTAVKFNEWHIGLFLNSTTGNWTWINGKALTINKWQPNKPDNDQDNKLVVYALIAKEYPPGYYGLFNNIKANINRAWICEEETDNCQGICMRHYHASTPSPTPSLRSTATNSTATAVKTDLSDSTTVTTTPELAGHKDDKRYFTEFIVAASLAVFLFIMLIAFAALAVVFFLKHKKRRKDARTPIPVGNPPEDDNGPLLNPENAATQLGLSETKDGIGRRENPQRATPSNREGEYTMLNPLTMAQGDKFYTSLEESEQEISASGAGDEPPTYVNQMPVPEYINV